MSSKTQTFTAEERAAMKEAARERKKGSEDGEADVLEKISEMEGSDREIATRVHELIKQTAPDLKPKTWYGMPAYADSEGKVVCHFQNAAKFKSRYATLGFSDRANLDDGPLWPTSFALDKLTPAAEKQIVALVKRAVS
jgi:uncharacterized protein YdhG (YjbR/CyaY superfamily)